MNKKEKNNNEAAPPLYDKTIRNTKNSVISQQKPPSFNNQERHFSKPQRDIIKIGIESEGQWPYTEDNNAPKDALFFVLITVTLIGLVHQLPNSFFGMANEYWMYKFRNTTSNSTDASDRTYLQTNFSALSGIIVTVPSVITNFLLTFVAHNITAKTRVMVTLILHTVIFCVQIVFININTDNWQEEFFILTMATIVVVMCSISFGAAGQYGLIPKLPPVYMKTYLLGGGMSSLFNAVMRLISVACSPSAVSSANIYFGTGSILLLLTTVVTYIAIYTSFFRHYTKQMEEVGKVKDEKIRTANDIKDVLIYLWPMLVLNVFLLAVPSSSISNLVVSEHHGEKGNVWANQYFVTVCSYLIPSVTNIVGRAVYNKLDWNWSMPAIFILVMFYQIVNTTTIYLSNALPRHHLPVLFKHDWEYALAMAIHGLAIGFITNMTNMKSIRMVPPDRTELAMLLLYFFNSVIQAAFSPLGVISVNLI